ncbi:hypothetical protein PGTUg99_001676 [Puccinia graminis f. sp. tritici]|uniref:Uncharacterized protein n=1 Tax=Puccinia graminis f. sp. tritici TaxID=56615 RepID=A0A5B0P7K4_PUCGR|nr:hypothetical protein PGTUg99_001676 [Puccinia graminis f. sp. tritici]
MPTVTLLLTLGWFSAAPLVAASMMRPPCLSDLEERPQNLMHEQEQAVMAHDLWGQSGIGYQSELEEVPCTVLDYRLLDDLETQIELQEILTIGRSLPWHPQEKLGRLPEMTDPRSPKMGNLPLNQKFY